MKRVVVAVISAALMGCAGSPMRQESDNTKAMIALRPDMTVDEAMMVMPPPARSEMYRAKNNDVVLIYFYLTNSMGYVTNPNDESNYTPLVFVGGRLNGWGWDHLRASSTRHEFVIKHR